jgi:hypothetical protein
MITSAALAIGFLVALAVALALSMALPAPALAQAQPPEGWQVFSSTEVYPASSEATFTISYPAGCERSFDCEQAGSFSFNGTDKMDNFTFQTFADVIDGGGSGVLLSISGVTLSAEDLEFILEQGHGIFLEDLCRQMTGLVGESDNDEPFTFKGHPAMDIFMLMNMEEGDDKVTFCRNRMIIKGKHLLTFNCLYTCDAGEAEHGLYTPMDHPAVETYFLPFLDSLEFVS